VSPDGTTCPQLQIVGALNVYFEDVSNAISQEAKDGADRGLVFSAPAVCVVVTIEWYPPVCQALGKFEVAL
jgi:hypothetical protein